MTFAASGGWQPPEPVPVEFVVDPQLVRNRLTTLFRIPLALPHLLVVAVAAFGLYVVLPLSWVCALASGRLPRPFASYIEGVLRYSARLQAYLGLLTDSYPPFSFGDVDYPVRLEITRGQLSRGAVLFRLILVVPAVFMSLVAVGFAFFSFVMWVLGVTLGRTPRSLYEAAYAVHRYQSRLSAYLMMATSTYPWGLFGDRAEPELGSAWGAAAMTAPVSPADPANPAVPTADPWAVPPPAPVTPSAYRVSPSAGTGQLRRVVLSAGSKALLIISLVFTVGGYGTGIAVVVVKTVRTTVVLTLGHRTFVQDLHTAARGLRACREVGCAHTLYATDAADTRKFEATVQALSVSSTAVAAQQELSQALEALAAAFDRVVAAPTAAEIIAAEPQLQDPANRVDAAYTAFITALSN